MEEHPPLTWSQAINIASPDRSEFGAGESVVPADITDDVDAFETAFDEFAYHLCWKR